MKKKYLFLVVLFGMLIYPLVSAPKDSDMWVNRGSVSRADIISVDIGSGEICNYLAYRDELTYIVDFRKIMLSDGYSEDEIKEVKDCLLNLKWINNDDGLSENVKQAMNYGNYLYFHSVILDDEDNIIGFLINKKENDHFYIGVMGYNKWGAWQDYTEDSFKK